jgi:hypothetical protein
VGWGIGVVVAKGSRDVYDRGAGVAGGVEDSLDGLDQVLLAIPGGIARISFY